MRTAIITGGTGGLGAAVDRPLPGRRLARRRPVGGRGASSSASSVARASSSSQADLFDAGRGRARSADVAGADTRAVVNLVGGFHAGGRVHETPVADLQAQLRINLEPAWLVHAAPRSRRCSPPARARSSASPRAPRCSRSPAAPAYAVAKAAVLAFVDALHVEYAQDGVRANAILPSVIDTPANRASQPDADASAWVTPGADRRHDRRALRARHAPRRAAPTSPSTERPDMPLIRRSTARPALRGGIDLGGTKIQALVLDDEHTVLGRGRSETPREGGPEAVLDALVATMQTRRSPTRARPRASSRASASARPAPSTRRPGPSPTRATCPTGSTRSRSPRSSRAGWPTSRCAWATT